MLERGACKDALQLILFSLHPSETLSLSDALSLSLCMLAHFSDCAFCFERSSASSLFSLARSYHSLSTIHHFRTGYLPFGIFCMCVFAKKVNLKNTRCFPADSSSSSAWATPPSARLLPQECKSEIQMLCSLCTLSTLRGN